MSIDLAAIGDTRMTRRLAVGVLAASAMVPLVGTASAQPKPTLTIVSPSNGTTIRANDITVQLKVSNFSVDCAQTGRPDQPGVGQILALVDGTTAAQLSNFFCTDTFTVPGDGLTPGPHQLAVVLASNTHVPMMATAQVVAIDFRPVQPVPLPMANYTGAPGVKLISPQDGATVPATFPVQVQPVNFSPTMALGGRANVPGYGHYHVWVDAPAKPSSLANLVLMLGTNGFTLDLSAWGPGKHTIRIEPAQNDHTMYDPSTPAAFTVTVSASATPAAGATASPAASAAAAAPLTIHMTSALRFDPADAKVGVGQTVTWVNDGPIQHTATDDEAKNPVAQAHPEYAQLPAGAAAWDSGLLDPGKSFSQTFTVPGTYHYFCLPHVLAGMRGTITVRG